MINAAEYLAMAAEHHRLAGFEPKACSEGAHSSRSVALAVIVPLRLKKTLIVKG